MKLGVVTFPGTCDDADARLAVSKVAEPVALWHGDSDLHGVDGVVVPGGFSYGDYLRAGAIARFSPVMESVIAFANAGGPVLGICNGFQILCEAGLLPGALLPNKDLRFVCRQVDLEVQTVGHAVHLHLRGRAAPVDPGQAHRPAASSARCADEQVVLRYAEGHNFNGSQDDIAGVTNAQGNVMGLMPHPEHAVDVLIGGSADGLKLFEGMARVAVA